jgi:hypothetical protein
VVAVAVAVVVVFDVVPVVLSAGFGESRHPFLQPD